MSEVYSEQCTYCVLEAEKYCENCSNKACGNCSDEVMQPIILDGHDRSQLCNECYDKEFTNE